MEYMLEYVSPIGLLKLVSNGQALTAVTFPRQRYQERRLTESVPDGQREELLLAKRWLDLYFTGKAPDFLPPLAPGGTAFRQLIWKLLLEIPYGESTTYGKLARQAASNLGRETMSPQAVGGAVGHNPINLIIPCHRVLGADGSLTGYGGGLEQKKYLLNLEGIRWEE